MTKLRWKYVKLRYRFRKLLFAEFIVACVAFFFTAAFTVHSQSRFLIGAAIWLTVSVMIVWLTITAIVALERKEDRIRKLQRFKKSDQNSIK